MAASAHSSDGDKQHVLGAQPPGHHTTNTMLCHLIGNNMAHTPLCLDSLVFRVSFSLLPLFAHQG